MFNNIGEKIKDLAKAIEWIGILASCAWGIFIICYDVNNLVGGVAIMAIGSLLSYLSTLTLYGFGQLIENSNILVKQAVIANNNLAEMNGDNGELLTDSQNSPSSF